MLQNACMKLGYARVSTSDQDASLQRDALKAVGREQCAKEIQRIIGGTVHRIEPIRPPGYKGPAVLGNAVRTTTLQSSAQPSAHVTIRSLDRGLTPSARVSVEVARPRRGGFNVFRTVTTSRRAAHTFGRIISVPSLF